ncbi:hypothetical protein OJ998_25305 [Solirubrobacter taibaiensis]|nr:hypothetical protein [Solirubrobacter taibaiensis]
MRVITLVILTVFAVAAPARAATVDVEFRGDPRRGSDVIVFKAAPGERNVLTSEHVGQTVTLRDGGAPITVLDSRCTAVEGGVSCPSWPLEAELGDQDDVSTVGGITDGGPGNDRLSGGGTLIGGPGEDVLTGIGPFVDDDGATPARDVYTGTGRSELSYGTRRTGIRIDLRMGRAAEDTVSGVPNVEGGYGDDVLIGDDGPNHLSGSRGGDRVVGLGGNDDLDAGSCCLYGFGGGAETILGGAGDDEIDPTGGRSATVRCGPGADETSTGPDRTFLAADCETVDTDAGEGRFAPDLRSATAAFFTFPRCGCHRHTFRVLAGDDQVVARASGRNGAVKLRLNALGRRLLRKDGRIAVRITSRDGDVDDGFRTVLKLRR